MKYITSILLIITLLLFNQILFSQEKVLESFDSASALQDWKIYKADGVEAEVSSAEGYKGKGIKFDYNFTKGTGYGGIQKIIPLDLPDNFQFTFYVKAESPANNFEIKFLDSTGHNVWWVNNRNYDFPTEWKKIKIKKRHISFAWGPTEDKSLKRIDRIEFTIASYVGGKGSIWIDELKFEELPDENQPIPEPTFFATSEMDEHPLKFISDNNPDTYWQSINKYDQLVEIDFQQIREFGGIVIRWLEGQHAEDFSIWTSRDRNNWNEVYNVKSFKGGKSFIPLKEEETRYLRIDLHNKIGTDGFAIKEIEIKDVQFSNTPNDFFINVAKEYPLGYYPRYFNEEGTFWTVVGVNKDVKEALINEDGIVEVDKKSFSIEPFLFVDDKLVTWNDVKKEQSLEKNYLPIPSVTWNYNDLLIETKVFAWGNENKYSVLYLRYALTNNISERKNGNLYLAIRPFQVNPYYQWLNITGGSSEISSIRYAGAVFINDDKEIIPITKDDGFGVAKFDKGDIISYLAENKIPQSKSVTDERGFASGCLSYSFDLDKGETKTIYIGVPFYDTQGLPILPGSQTDSIEERFNKLFSATKEFWESKLNHVKFNLPKSADKIINTWKSNLAYILINRDKAGIQPGSRSYERSWIRDGALTSSALLKSGIVEEVKDFIDWYSAHQYENGKVPCVVDTRGPDPVPENDSHGEMIYLIKEYFNFTKDTTFLRSKNENILKAVEYIQSQVAERSTDHFKNGNDSVRAYYGIMPESISHEGYSAKPMHSYWDDFFTMKGLKDAAEIQNILGEKESYEKIKKVRDTFQKNLYNSLDLAIKTRNIDYIPGCVELGDFDATSTTIAISPCNELHNLPQPFAKNTFDGYYEFFKNRRDNKIDWTGYTPYENRLIGSFIFLDQPEKAHELIDFILDDQRPQGWNHWAEVVWKDERHPGYIGDMPHTWVGSDFINAVRSMFVYENEYDSSLVVGAALYQDWIDSPNGMSIENLPTYYGELSYSVKKNENEYNIKLYGDVSLPLGGIIIKNFNGSKMPMEVFINEEVTKDFSENKIVIREFPAEVKIVY